MGQGGEPTDSNLVPTSALEVTLNYASRTGVGDLVRGYVKRLYRGLAGLRLGNANWERKDGDSGLSSYLSSSQ